MRTGQDIANALNTGFIDYTHMSLENYHPKLLLNDSKRGCKVLTTLTNELLTCEEFLFSVAFVTNSGVASLISILKELEHKGIKGKIVVSQYQNFTEPNALKRLINLSNLELRIVTENNFHAKGYIFKKKDNYTLIVGSSNLTQNALSFNREWNIKLSSMQDGLLLKDTIAEFTNTFDNAVKVDETWINEYENIYNYSKGQQFTKTNPLDDDISIDTFNLVAANIAYSPPSELINLHRIVPNKMQVQALSSLENLRNDNKNKALLISATGTGKTFLSAFDVKKFAPERFLFVVHRENIARAAQKSYCKILGHCIDTALLSGSSKNTSAKYIFATIQTLSKENILSSFNPTDFDYIVIDEVHRSGAESYQRIIDYFKPKFLLGMSATPERTDGYDIFKAFDYNIAYEIRLNRALEENMLVPFHYYGISDISIDGIPIDDTASFNDLISNTRVDKILEAAKIYSFDRGRVKGLIFCSKVEEAKELSRLFNERGLNTLALSSEDSEDAREKAIQRLESDSESNTTALDYIFTVDIFNEGVDIPSINQIIMLRPTQSSIIFIQQLGRGLRKKQGKEFLVVIDFIGNYKNNFLIPIALYGDNSYNKDNLRKLLKNGNSFIPGASTINFDKITKERIFEAINAASMTKKADLVKDYKLLKYKLGRIPTMMDFVNNSSRDPYLYVDYSGSYFSFIMEQEDTLRGRLNKDEMKLLEIYSKEIANGKRLEEAQLLKMLIESEDNAVSSYSFKEAISSKYGYTPDELTINSVINNLNFGFVTEKQDKKLISQCEKYGYSTADYSNELISLNVANKTILSNTLYKDYLLDALNYAIYNYDCAYSKEKFVDGFILYKKYSRKDVFRILNWNENPVAQNVGGYIISGDKKQCPIFVNYHKAENISSTTKYEDYFINNRQFEWVSKSKRNLESPDILAIKNYKIGMRIPLFIKKSNDEGSEFYYMGDLTPIEDSIRQDYMIDDEKNNKVSVVKIRYELSHAVESNLYDYIVG